MFCELKRFQLHRQSFQKETAKSKITEKWVQRGPRFVWLFILESGFQFGLIFFCAVEFRVNRGWRCQNVPEGTPQRQVEVHPTNIIQMLGRKWFDLKIDFSISNCCQNVVEEEVNSYVFFNIFQID